MKRPVQTQGAAINPILAVVLALVALLTVFLILNPPRVVDAPTTSPATSDQTDSTDSDQDSGDQTSSTNDDQSSTNSGGDNSSASTSSSSTSASSDCAEDSNTNRDGVWRAQMNGETRGYLEQIINSYGGIEALLSICTLHGKGTSTIESQGQSVKSDVELWIRVPNQLRHFINIHLPFPGQFLENLIVWEGRRGWAKQFNPNSLQYEVSEIPVQLMVEVIEEIELHPVLFLLAIQDGTATFNYLGNDEPDNPGAIAIEFRTKLGSAGTFYYDPTNFETLSLVREGGGRKVEKIYSNFVEVDGIKLPHQLNTTLTDPSIGESQTELIYESIEINSDLHPELFEQPE